MSNVPLDQAFQETQLPRKIQESFEMTGSVLIQEHEESLSLRPQFDFNEKKLGTIAPLATALTKPGVGSLLSFERMGAFGRPLTAVGKLRRARRGGGSKDTESAVGNALQWLAEHQEDDGHWKVGRLEGRAGAELGVSALALLAFLAAGHTEKRGKYKKHVSRTIAWFISLQGKDGAIARNSPEFWHPGFAYHHVMCGLALSEAFAMGKVPQTGEAAQHALNYTCNVLQQGEGSEKKAWRYLPDYPSMDSSISGWCVMQLKSSNVAGLKIDPANYEGAFNYFTDIQCHGPKSDGLFPYMKGGKPAVATTAIGILSKLLLGERPQKLQEGALFLSSNLPRWDPKLGKGGVGKEKYFPMYYVYYGTLALHLMGGHHWNVWNSAMKKMLLPNQIKDGPNKGSWKPVGGSDDAIGGRVYMTALAALSLETYYRYLPLSRE